MANLHGEDRVVTDCGEARRSGNSLLIGEPTESQKSCKRVNSSPVGEESEAQQKKKARDDCGDSRSFFDCKICLDMAREPVVTYCGHLFCWACFYQVRYVDSSTKTKECPVCRGEVTDSSIIPIYGNEDSTEESKSELSFSSIIPPRPKAQRIESVNLRAGSQIPGAESQVDDWPLFPRRRRSHGLFLNLLSPSPSP